jgi:hypothetical protein
MSSIPRKFWCPSCAFNVWTPHGCPGPDVKPLQQLRERPPLKRSEAGLMFLSISEPSIAGRSVSMISVSPQVECRPLRLVVSPSIAECFGLRDLRIGNISYFAAYSARPGGIRTDCFPPIPDDRVIDNLCGLPKIPISSSLFLIVENLDICAHDFSGFIAATTEV